MSEFPYLRPLVAMLGEGRSSYADPEAWRRLAERFRFELPEDYKEIIDRYGPVQLNGHLFLSHPATARWNLAEEIESTSRAYSEIPWDGDELEGDGDPSASLGIPKLEFGTPVGLVPAVGSDRGESVFLAQGARGGGWRVFVMRDYECHEYRMDFSEWLYRYLVGEDMAGPNSSAFYPGPVRFEGLPMSRGEETVTWYGPDRGM